jgi:hypothetical protein
MIFEIGDETDTSFTTTIVYEQLLCEDSFERFVQIKKLSDMGMRDKGTQINCYDAYTSFLHHLYECYVGCIKRDRRNTKDIDSNSLDKIFNNEVIKLPKNRIHAIEKG